MKCQIKIITWYYYSKKADKELKRGNFETHVPSHRCLLNTRQRLPVGLHTNKTFSCPKVLQGLVRTAPRIWNPHREFQLLTFCSPRTTKCYFKVNVAFLNPYWDTCQTSLCKLCVNLYMYDDNFLEFQKSWPKRDVSKESTRVHPHRTHCSALHLHFRQLLTEDRAHRLVWDTSSFYASKIKFGCLVNMAFLRIWEILTG